MNWMCSETDKKPFSWKMSLKTIDIKIERMIKKSSMETRATSKGQTFNSKTCRYMVHLKWVCILQQKLQQSLTAKNNRHRKLIAGKLLLVETSYKVL